MEEMDRVCPKRDENHSICAKMEKNDSICTKMEEKDSIGAKTEENNRVCAKIEEKDTVCAKIEEKDSISAKIEEKGTYCAKMEEMDAYCAKMEEMDRVCAKVEEKEEKVFLSRVKRGTIESQSDLYELFKVVPARPQEIKKEEEIPCDFQPKYDKLYVPKRTKVSKHSKVKTVRDLRRQYEKDINVSLPEELDRQQNALLKKIRYKSTYNESTKNLARKLLKSEDPVSRAAWEMLTNVNPENHRHSTQYVLWNGRNIRINGSKGGKVKFLCKYDLAKNNQSTFNRNQMFKRPCLLKESVVIKFKPGPLSKKVYLDTSYQKHNVGSIKLLGLPKPCFEIKPVLGSNLEPAMANFVEHMREPNGSISKEWAQYAVSMVGRLHKGKPRQLEQQEPICFDLKYKFDQKQMIMRCSEDINHNIVKVEYETGPCEKAISYDTIEENIQNIMTDIINSIEISEMQNSLLLEDDTVDLDQSVTKFVDKDKHKKRYKELDRLAITVIELPDNSSQKSDNKCDKPHCALGCVCLSLQKNYHIRKHCGRIDCMFDCKCNFKLNNMNNSMSCLPHLLHMDKEINSKLAKEEQKFHQTVVMSGEKSILLKSHKRSCRASTKYNDNFLTGIKQETELKETLVLHLGVSKLNINNIEPWCMVHKLYKCFCKGRFAESVSKVIESANKDNVIKEKTENSVKEKSESSSKTAKSANILPVEISDSSPEKKETSGSHLLKQYLASSKPGVSLLKKSQDHECSKCPDTNKIGNNSFATYSRNIIESNIPIAPKPSGYKLNCIKDLLNAEPNAVASMSVVDTNATVNTRRTYKQYNSESNSSIESDTILSQIWREKCARTEPFPGRKHRDAFYSRANQKIKKFEDNDKVIKKRLITIMGLANLPDVDDLNSGNSLLKPVSITSSPEKKEDLLPLPPPPNKETNNQGSLLHMMAKRFGMLSKAKLVTWLEQSYIQYKERQAKGITKNSLDPPRLNKFALYPWEFILSRYRDRKNIFLITNKIPYHIFMAVDSKSPFFKDCININEIRLAELHKYPQTVKSLLTNNSDMNDNFCILCGLKECWEIIGSVTKVDKDNETAESEENQPFLGVDSSDLLLEYPLRKISQIPDSSEPEDPDSNNGEPNVEMRVISWETSKWFLMVIEKDFSEIQFFEKGFFVKYESIIKAINVARISGKTVRLSAAQKGADASNGPLFGIYAIPNAKDYCVFVGPYEENEPLGIETIKILTHQRKSKPTRGIWITTKKIDNMKVIDNPMMFMPTAPADEEMTPLASDVNKPIKIIKKVKKRSNESTSAAVLDDNIEKVDTLNIKAQDNKNEENMDLETQIDSTAILKNNNATDIQQSDSGLVENTSAEASEANLKSLDVTKTGLKSLEPTISEPKDNNKFAETSSDTPIESSEDEKNEKKIVIKTNDGISLSKIVKPIKIHKSNGMFKLAQTLIPLKAPNRQTVFVAGPKKYVKVKHVPSVHKSNVGESKTNVKISMPKPVAEIAPFGKDIVIDGMKILKPEQINQRVADLAPVQNNNQTDIEEDIERFLAQTEQVECGDPSAVFVISDDEDEPAYTEPLYKDVFIECKNVDIGWIRGQQNKDGMLSFEFPGFKFTDFYPPHDAFVKIYQVLSRKMYIPKSTLLQWTVVETQEDLKSKEMLSSDKLGPNFVLTKRGIRHKNDLKLAMTEPPKKKTLRRFSAGDVKPSTSTSTNEEDNNVFFNTDTAHEQDEEKNKSEEDSNMLWENRIQILNTLSNVSMENKEEMIGTLNDMLNSNDT